MSYTVYMNRVLIILAQQGYQDKEYAGTRNGLESAGYEIMIASTEAGECLGKFGGSALVDLALRDVDIKEFDIIAFIGGPGAAALAQDEDAKRIARDALAHGKKLGAICIAPTILARAGVLKGKRATVWDNGGVQAKLLQSEGATYTGESVTRDGDIVTANGPEVAEEFGQLLAAL